MLLRPRPRDIFLALGVFVLGALEWFFVLTWVGNALRWNVGTPLGVRIEQPEVHLTDLVPEGHYASVFEGGFASTHAPAGLVLPALCGVVLAWRRGPLPVAPVAPLALLLPDHALGSPWTAVLMPYAPLVAAGIAIFSMTANATLGPAVVGVGAGSVAIALAVHARTVPEGLAVLLFAGVLVVAARLLRSARERARQLTALSASLDRERVVAGEFAVADERARITRDVHDAVAHAVAMMVVQAAAADAVLEHEPERARKALGIVQAAGRQAIDELRGTLRILRAGSASASAPAPAAAPAPAPARAQAAPRAIAVLLAVLTIDAVLVPPTAAAVAGLAIALFVVGMRAPGRLAAAATACACAIGVAGVVRLSGRFDVEFIADVALLFSLPVGIGAATRAWREEGRRTLLLNARLEREREARARLAAVEERAGIARELHDAVAHGISVMVLQAGAADAVLDRSRAQARDAIAAITDTGRAVLEELRQLLGILRLEDEAVGAAATPTLAELDALLARFGAAGLAVDLRLHGEPVELPPSIDTCAYRIIQEALTNARKHAAAGRAQVVIDYEPDALHVEIRNAGPLGAATAGGGYGVLGMRERVAVHDGTLTAAPGDDGGFIVRARIPLP